MHMKMLAKFDEYWQIYGVLKISEYAESGILAFSAILRSQSSGSVHPTSLLLQLLNETIP